MTDEVYEFIQDCKDKKITARSARNKRTHTGKGGRVRFPSDNLTKKEREAMNGKVESYRMNDPISWKEFKSWPEEHQVTYIKLLRQKYNAPDKAIAIMMGVSRPYLCKHIGELGLSLGRGANKKSDSWDEDGFYAWCGMVKVNEKIPVEEVPSEPVEEPAAEVDILDEESIEDATEGYNLPHCSDTCTTDHHIPVIPASGNMTFDNNNADDALDSIRALLGNAKVNIRITWDVVNEDGTTKYRPYSQYRPYR